MAKKLLRDPNAPKRNMSAYLLYQNGMREQFKAQNPGMTFGQLAKYTSAMYAEMPPAEKEAWRARAEADKARYLHELSSYVPPPGFDAKGDAIIASQVAAPKKRTKSGRDPNAPKRNLSAYLLFQNAMRDQYKCDNPGMTFGQLAKYTSHMYKNLSPEEKQMWVTRSEQDKARYDAEIATYVSPPGHDAHGNLIDITHGKRQKRSMKDPHAPKRARGSFVFFTFEMRPKIMVEFPGIKFVEMGTILGQRWRALTPENKKRFEDMAAEDKVRFHLEMQKYTGQLNQMEAQAQAQAQAAMQHHQQQQQQQHQHQLLSNQQQQQHQVQASMLQQQYYTQSDPNIQQYDPNQHQLDPNQHQLDPNQHQLDPNQHQLDPNQHQLDPNQHQLDPNQHQLDPNQHQLDPNQHQLDPNQHQLDPNQHQLDPNQHQLDPNQHHQQMDQNHHNQMNRNQHQSMDPTQHQQMDPSQHQSMDPNQHQQMDPNQHQSMDPNQHQSMDSNQQHQYDPNQQQEHHYDPNQQQEQVQQMQQQYYDSNAYQS